MKCNRCSYRGIDINADKKRCDKCIKSAKEYDMQKQMERLVRVTCPLILQNGKQCTYENINKDESKIIANCHEADIFDNDFIRNVKQNNVFCDRL